MAMLSACSKDEKAKVNNTVNDNSDKAAELLSELDFEYVYETDCQINNGQHPINAYTKDGEYYLQHTESLTEPVNTSWLYFCDKASGQDIVVCGKSNCNHRSKECDAYFSGEEYPIAYLWYYEEALYTLMLKEDYLYMEKISLDGSVREESCMLTRLNVQTEIQPDGTEVESNTYYPELQIHRGYAYYSTYYSGCTQVQLYRVKLDGEEEPELLYSDKRKDPGLYRIKPYGRYVLFQVGNFSADYTNMTSSIYAYDTEAGEVTRICDEALRDYTVVNNCLYYFDLENNVYCKDLRTGMVNMFFEADIETEGYDCKLFGIEEGLIYQITDWDNEGAVQQILLDCDESGKDPEYFEEEKFQPYSF